LRSARALRGRRRRRRSGKSEGGRPFAAIIQGFASIYQIFIRTEIMPIYAYRCDSCGFEKDVLQKISDAPLTQCPSCGKDAFRKQVTAAGFQLKGSGWYVTDFRGGNGGKSAPAAASKPGGESSAPDGGSSAAASGDSSGGASGAAASAPAASTGNASGNASGSSSNKGQ
jgi:putative FmdB family regulatory protein